MLNSFVTTEPSELPLDEGFPRSSVWEDLGTEGFQVAFISMGLAQSASLADSAGVQGGFRLMRLEFCIVTYFSRLNSYTVFERGLRIRRDDPMDVMKLWMIKSRLSWLFHETFLGNDLTLFGLPIRGKERIP